MHVCSNSTWSLGFGMTLVTRRTMPLIQECGQVNFAWCQKCQAHGQNWLVGPTDLMNATGVCMHACKARTSRAQHCRPASFVEGMRFYPMFL